MTDDTYSVRFTATELHAIEMGRQALTLIGEFIEHANGSRGVQVSLALDDLDGFISRARTEVTNRGIRQRLVRTEGGNPWRPW